MTLHILNLLKKDCLIVKNNLLLMMGFTIFFSVFLVLRTPSLAGAPLFIMLSIFIPMLTTSFISQAEYKAYKVMPLLCASPYSRTAMVISRYLFLYLIFFYCCIVYFVVMLILQMKQIQFSSVLTSFLILSILYGICEPLEYQIGFEKIQYLFIMLIMVIPFGTVFILKLDLLSKIHITNLPPNFILYILMAAAVIVINAISITISSRIFARREL